MMENFESCYFLEGRQKLHYYHRVGSSARIVFLHGLGTAGDSWARLVEELPEELEIYAVDIPGHGKSSVPQEFTHEAQAQLMQKFVGGIGGDATVFGHSYGGWLAIGCALSCPNVKALVIEDSAGLASHFKGIVDAGRKKEHFSTMMDNLKRRGGQNEKVVQRMLESAFESGHITDVLLRQLKLPTLILWGELDNRIPIGCADTFHRGIMGSRLVIIDGAKHTPHYTNPKEVAEALLDFIKSGK
jgi:pimeloyl-ACP methyl ester carboxylesterase